MEIFIISRYSVPCFFPQALGQSSGNASVLFIIITDSHQATRQFIWTNAGNAERSVCTSAHWIPQEITCL